MKHYIVEFDRNYKGLRLVGIFGDRGYRCGYVGVPKENKYYGKDYMNMDFISCHGGLTFSSGIENSTYPISSNLWWFGFDCIHLGDGTDVELVEKIFHKPIVDNLFDDDYVISQSEVMSNCTSIARQLLGEE